jgi:cytidylate kinase
MVIAIDGPAGAGKSTIAKLIAKRFGLQYLDTGAMYRAFAVKAMRLDMIHASPEELGLLAEKLDLRFDGDRLFMDGEDVSEAIRQPVISELSSALSVHPPVRRALVALQQTMIASGGWTLEGRDTTTVVAPDADIKLYLDASPKVRASRRTKELRERGISADTTEVLSHMMSRDARDKSRADSPLTIAPDADLVITDDLTIEEVFQRVDALVKRR